MSDLQQATITIKSITEKDNRMSIKAVSGGIYSLFKTKKDNTPSVAYQQMRDMGLKSGITVDITYDTSTREYQGKPIQYKNIKTFREASIQRDDTSEFLEEKEKKPDWEAISRGKVRHGIVCAMIGAKYPIEDIKTHLTELTNLVMNEDREVDIKDIPF